MRKLLFILALLAVTFLVTRGIIQIVFCPAGRVFVNPSDPNVEPYVAGTESRVCTALGL